MSNGMTKRERKVRIRKGLPIEALGLQFFPVTMADYEEFLECKNALAIRMTSLAKTNIEYLSMPFLSALWAMELDTVRATGKAIGFFERTIRMLYLSLRLEYDSQKVFSHIYCDENNPRNLLYVEVEQTDGKPVKISPAEFTTIVRPLIAEQNGIDLPNESYDDELVEEEQYITQEQSSKVKFDMETLIASVANASRLRECDIDEWTVKEFERRRQAIDRDKYFMLYTQAEMSGMVKFKKGNPYPSWCLDKEQGLSPALKTASELKGNFAAVGDIEQAVGQANKQY
jgi:hypothetical protein